MSAEHENVLIDKTARVGKYCVIEGTKELPTVIGRNVVIKEFVKIYPGVRLGDDSIVEENCVLGHPSKAALVGHDSFLGQESVKDRIVDDPVTVIGEGAVIRSGSTIYGHLVIGDNFQTGHHAMVREHTRIGDNVVFGSYASCDGYSKIGNGTQVGQYVMLARKVTLGDACFIGGHTTFGANKYTLDNEGSSQGAVVEDLVRIGLNCCVAPDVVIGKHALIGMNTLINRSIPQGKLAYGNPVRIQRDLTSEEIEDFLNSR